MSFPFPNWDHTQSLSWGIFNLRGHVSRAAPIAGQILVQPSAIVFRSPVVVRLCQQTDRSKSISVSGFCFAKKTAACSADSKRQVWKKLV
jgi:hypothetical protein